MYFSRGLPHVEPRAVPEATEELSPFLPRMETAGSLAVDSAPSLVNRELTPRDVGRHTHERTKAPMIRILWNGACLLPGEGRPQVLAGSTLCRSCVWVVEPRGGRAPVTELSTGPDRCDLQCAPHHSCCACGFRALSHSSSNQISASR